MSKRTKICFNVCQMVWNKKKRQKKISPNSGHSRGGGGQDGKWSHFPPLFFLNPSLSRSYKGHQISEKFDTNKEVK